MTYSRAQGDSKMDSIREEALQMMHSGNIQGGIVLLQEATRLSPDSADLWNSLGAALLQAQRIAEAEECFLKALEIAPAHVKALNNCAYLFVKQGRLAEGESILRRVLEADSRQVDALFNLGQCLRLLGRSDEAFDCFERAVKNGFQKASVFSAMGNIFVERNKNLDAERCFRQALAMDSVDFVALKGMGDLLKETHPDEAAGYYCRAIDVNPRDGFVWYNLAALYEYTNKINDALELIGKARAYFPSHVGLSLVEAKIFRRQGKGAEALKILEAALPQKLELNSLYAPLYFEMGQICDSINDCARAFEYFSKGNLCMKQSAQAQSIDRSAFPAMVEKCKRVFTSDWVRSWPATSAAHESPVFLVGFPRSGTTLLDQILSSHPDIFVAEERPALDMVRNNLEAYGSYPESLARLGDMDIARLREVYYAEHHRYSDWSKRPIFVDKHPLNMVHCGLMQRLFPSAKFILALRHPYDAVLSCFMQFFALNQAMIHFTDLHDAARLYDDVFSLWYHYNLIMPVNVHVVRYEDVVSDFHPTVTKLLDFLDVEWNDSVLQYDSTAMSKQQIFTPSYHQVSRKIYKSSSMRWMRYRDQIEPVLPLLRPWVEKLGYEAG